MKRLTLLLLAVFTLFAAEGNQIDGVTSASRKYNVNGGTAYEDKIDLEWYAGYSNGEVFFSYGPQQGNYTDTVQFADVSRGNHNETITGLTPDQTYYFNLWGSWRGIITTCEGTFVTTGAGTVTFTVTVINGTGSGDYEVGSTVTISANDSADYSFNSWIGDNDILNDVSSQNTSFTMPESDVTVTASYRENSVDTLNPSQNITTSMDWGVQIDTLGSSVDTGSALIKDGTVKAKLTVVASDEANDKWAYGSVDCWLPEDGSSLNNGNYIKVTYKTNGNFKLVLPQGTLADDGLSYEKALPKTGSSYETVLWKLDDKTFAQPEWFTGTTTPLDLAEVKALSFAMQNDGESGTIEISEVVIYNYEGNYPDWTPIAKTATVQKTDVTLAVNGEKLILSSSVVKAGTVKLLSLNGRELYSQMKSFDAGETAVSLSGLSRGVYLVQFQSNTSPTRLVKRFVVE